jgi:phage tail sheath protein FI
VPDSPIPQPTKIIPPIRPTLESIITAHLQAALAFTSTQPNAEPLWANVRSTAANYLMGLFRKGTLKGDKPDQAYFVKCGLDTMTQLDIDNGRVIVLVGFAPIAPAEFTNIRLSLPAARQ